MSSLLFLFFFLVCFSCFSFCRIIVDYSCIHSLSGTAAGTVDAVVNETGPSPRSSPQTHDRDRQMRAIHTVGRNRDVTVPGAML